MDQIPPHGKVGELPELTFKRSTVSLEAFLKLQINMVIHLESALGKSERIAWKSCDHVMTGSHSYPNPNPNPFRSSLSTIIHGVEEAVQIMAKGIC